MSHKSLDREEFERSNAVVSWQTYRKRIKLGWGKQEALSLSAGAKDKHIVDSIPMDKLSVSVGTVRRRLRNPQFQKQHRNSDTRLRRAVQDQPYGWPEVGNTYNNWMICQITRRSADESPGARAIVRCLACGTERRYLLKYVKNGLQQHCC